MLVGQPEAEESLGRTFHWTYAEGGIYDFQFKETAIKEDIMQLQG